MERLTSSNTFEMNMYQLALNQVYISQDGWAQYVEGPDRECSVCDLIRAVSKTLGVELPILDNEDLSDLMTDWLQYGAEKPEGVVAVLYRALCAMASVRDKLFRYEDTCLTPEEVAEYQHLCESYVEAGLDYKFVQFCIDATQNGLSLEVLQELAQAEKDGRLVVLPCKKGDTLWSFYNYPASGICKIAVTAVSTLEGITVINTDNYGVIPEKDIGKTVFLTREEAVAAMKKREED